MKFICTLFSLNLFILLVQSVALNDIDNIQRDDPIIRSNKECKYEKEPWSDCDLATGLQKRVLKLKAHLQQSTQCEPTKEFTRQCKKACRYNKGTWSECLNGEKTRVDTLRPVGAVTSLSTPNAPGECEPTRTTKKRCKQPSNCKYTKSQWSACDESGQKSKTLSLEQGDPSECEEKKTITKQCNQNKKSGRRANRKKNKKDRNDNKKQELLATTEESKDVKDASEEGKEE